MKNFLGVLPRTLEGILGSSPMQLTSSCQSLPRPSRMMTMTYWWLRDLMKQGKVLTVLIHFRRCLLKSSAISEICLRAFPWICSDWVVVIAEISYMWCDGPNMSSWLYCSELYIKASSKGRPFTIREVKASNIGQLVRISGIVTRCSDVKPLMKVAVYTCEDCGFEIYQVIDEMTAWTAQFRD